MPTDLAFTPLLTLAQAEPAQTSLWSMVLKGGVMMIPIALCSLIVLAVVAERLVTLRSSKVIPPRFVNKVRRLLEEEGPEPALAACNARNAPVARVLAAGIERLGRPVELVEKHIAAAGETEVVALRKYTRVLSVVYSVAPLLGLTGTIFGMIAAFQTVARSADALGRTEQLAGGIYEAMITTAAGLLVAIPALVFHQWLMSRIERLVREMDAVCVDFVETFAAPAARPAPPVASGAAVRFAAGHE